MPFRHLATCNSAAILVGEASSNEMTTGISIHPPATLGRLSGHLFVDLIQRDQTWRGVVMPA